MTYRTLLVSNNNCIHELQYYKLKKFQDFKRPRNSTSRTFEDQPCFQVLSMMRGNPVRRQRIRNIVDLSGLTINETAWPIEDRQKMYKTCLSCYQSSARAWGLTRCCSHTVKHSALPTVIIGLAENSCGFYGKYFCRTGQKCSNVPPSLQKIISTIQLVNLHFTTIHLRRTSTPAPLVHRQIVCCSTHTQHIRWQEFCCCRATCLE